MGPSPTARDVTSLAPQTENVPAPAKAGDGMAGVQNEDPPAKRWSEPGTAFTRAEPAAPFDPRLIVTAQVAYGDIFVHTLAGIGPRYVEAGKVYRGQKVVILPFARNYGRATDERTDLTYELEIRKPDGSVDGDVFKGVLWQDRIGSAGMILFPVSNVTFWTEATDPEGEYQIVARVYDHLAGETRELVHRLRHVDYVVPELPADFDPDRWFHTYYLQPAPELALPAAARFFSRLPADKRESAMPPLLGFYDQILTDNPWLLPAFSRRLELAEPDEAFALALILGYHCRAAVEAPAGVSAEAWTLLADFRAYKWPAEPVMPLTMPAQLDTLWGNFFASGLYLPVQRMMEPLANTADIGATERWHKAAKAALAEGEEVAGPDMDDPELPIEVRRDILLRTALWSLRATARQHPLVRGYLEWTVRTAALPAATLALVERALQPDVAPAEAAQGATVSGEVTTPASEAPAPAAK